MTIFGDYFLLVFAVPPECQKTEDGLASELLRPSFDKAVVKQTGNEFTFNFKKENDSTTILIDVAKKGWLIYSVSLRCP